MGADGGGGWKECERWYDRVCWVVRGSVAVFGWLAARLTLHRTLLCRAAAANVVAYSLCQCHMYESVQRPQAAQCGVAGTGSAVGVALG